MNRKPRTKKNSKNSLDILSDWKQHLMTRRQLLIIAAGGSLSTMGSFSSGLHAKTDKSKTVTVKNPWPIIDVVQQHLFPVEDDAPGAREINALAYLKFIVSDTTVDVETREFITRGVAWLEDMTEQMYQKSFVTIDEKQREKILRRIASSDAGENWLSTLMLYIVEALLTDPIYGGNTDQVGWRWLKHIPGYPRPTADKTFQQLIS